MQGETLEGFCRSWHERLTVKATGGPVIYHYTAAPGLLGILGGGSLRATNIAFLNDSAEYYLSLERIQSALDRFARAEGRGLGAFLDGMGQRLREATHRIPEVYVVSFSRAADLLSQWRGYGEVESGYAVGFDIRALTEGLRQAGALLVPCVYEAEAQDAFADDLVRTVADLWCRASGGSTDGDGAAALLDEAFGRLAWFAALFKHPGFAEEQEWRLVSLLAPDQADRLEFIARETCVATYLPVPFPKQAVREIWVGPSRHQHLSLPAIDALLRKAGYPADTALHRSEVPFRLV